MGWDGSGNTLHRPYCQLNEYILIEIKIPMLHYVMVFNLFQQFVMIDIHIGNQMLHLWIQYGTHKSFCNWICLQLIIAAALTWYLIKRNTRKVFNTTSISSIEEITLFELSIYKYTGLVGSDQIKRHNRQQEVVQFCAGWEKVRVER